MHSDQQATHTHAMPGKHQGESEEQRKRRTNTGLGCYALSAVKDATLPVLGVPAFQRLGGV